MQTDTAAGRLVNRAALEQGLVEYWCQLPTEAMREFLRQNMVAADPGWDDADYQKAIEEYIRTRPDGGLASLADEIPLAGAPGSIVPAPEWEAPATEPAAAAEVPAYTIRTGNRELAVRQVGRTKLAGVSVKWIFASGLGVHEVDVRNRQDRTVARYDAAGVKDSELVRRISQALAVESLGAEVAEARAAAATQSAPDQTAPPATAAATDAELPLDRIRIRRNYRRIFDEAKLAELTADVRQHGVQMPVLVRPADDGDGWELVAGERRYRASINAGLEIIPARVKVMDRQRADELQLLENIQRQDLNPLEESEAYQYLMQEYGYTQEQLAVKFSRSQSHISERLGLLEIRIPAVREALERGVLSARAALALRPLMPADPKVKPGATVLAIAQQMVKDSWSAAVAAGRVKDSLWSNSKRLTPFKGQPSTYNAPYEAMFVQDECASCPHRAQLRGDERATCLNPPCWDKKQKAAYARWKEEHTRPEREAEQAREAKRLEQTQRAIQKQAAKVEEAASLPPAEDFAAMVLKLHESSRSLEGYLSPSEKNKATTETERIAGALGFSSPGEIEDWLSAGTGRLAPHKLPVHQLGARLTEIVAARRAGQTLEQYAQGKVQQVAQATLDGKAPAKAAASAPPMPDLTLAQKVAAEELQELAAPVWSELIKGRDRWDYARECYLPLERLLQFWRDQHALGASQMPLQMDGPTVRIPEQAVWFSGRGSGGGVVVLLDGRLLVTTGSGAVEDAAPADPVYYRVQVTGGGPHFGIQQLLIIPCQGRHLVISDSDGATVRRDLVRRWWELFNALPAMPKLKEDDKVAD